MVGYKIKSIKKHTGLLRHKSPQDTGNIQKPVVSVYKIISLNSSKVFSASSIAAFLEAAKPTILTSGHDPCPNACHFGVSRSLPLKSFESTSPNPSYIAVLHTWQEIAPSELCW